MKHETYETEENWEPILVIEKEPFDYLRIWIDGDYYLLNNDGWKDNIIEIIGKSFKRVSRYFV